MLIPMRMNMNSRSMATSLRAVSGRNQQVKGMSRPNNGGAGRAAAEVVVEAAARKAHSRKSDRPSHAMLNARAAIVLVHARQRALPASNLSNGKTKSRKTTTWMTNCSRTVSSATWATTRTMMKLAPMARAADRCCSERFHHGMKRSGLSSTRTCRAGRNAGHLRGPDRVITAGEGDRAVDVVATVTIDRAFCVKLARVFGQN